MIVPLLGSTLDECCKITVNEKCQETVQTLKKKKKKRKRKKKQTTTKNKKQKNIHSQDTCCVNLYVNIHLTRNQSAESGHCLQHLPWPFEQLLNLHPNNIT